MPREYLTSDVLMLANHAGSTVIGEAARYGDLDQLLGLELLEICRYETGDEWWEKNNAVRREKAGLMDPLKDVGVDLF